MGPEFKTRVRRGLALACAIACVAGAGSARAVTATIVDTTAGETPFIVPAGVTGVTVALTGASGGAGLDPNFTFDNSSGGIGGTASATVAVAPGEVLFLEVGGAGGPGTGLGVGAGGANGGAPGGLQGPGGGGGGATDVRTCSATAGNGLDPAACALTASLATRLLVAGGGGGGGGSGSAATFPKRRSPGRCPRRPRSQAR